MTSSTRLLATSLAVLLLGFGKPARADRPAAGVRRLALIITANDGGRERVRLRYAESDGQALADVLTKLGGVRAEDLTVIREATPARLRAAFDTIKSTAAAVHRPGERLELFVYYSGHSDESGLMLGEQRLSYRELRGRIEEVKADVRIAILDSCASGALIRSKGGVHRPPFLGDVGIEASGHAFLAASSADEAAQESDRIGAAYFTHYLISGLRGAADADHDGWVTLNEAYRFAYDETLRRTQGSRAGAQHPAYDIQLVGTRDLVITDLHTTNARLVLAARLGGRIYIRDSGGALRVETHKDPIDPVELGLEAGRFRVTVDQDGQVSEATVELHDGAQVALGPESFKRVPTSLATLRGDRDEPAHGYRLVPFDLVLAPGVALFGGTAGDPVLNHVTLGLLSQSDVLHGVGLSVVGNIARDEVEGLRFSPGFNLSYGPVAGAEFSFGSNVAFNDLQGVQGTLFANVATHGMDGVQFGVVNIGGTVRGLQVGVVNVASSVQGVQFGVINVAHHNSGVAFGPFPLVGDGYHALQVWSSDVSFSNVGLKVGTRHVYTLLGLGWRASQPDGRPARPTKSFGFGGHITPWQRPLFVDLDVTSLDPAFGNDDGGRLVSLRAMLGARLSSQVTLIAGPALNTQISWGGHDYRSGVGFANWVVGQRDIWRFFPGFIVGLQV